MTMQIAQIIALLVEIYALIGLAFAIVFLPRGILRVDDHLRGSPVAVRLLILPGVAALWPLFAWRWMTGQSAPVERNAHRVNARRDRR